LLLFDDARHGSFFFTNSFLDFALKLYNSFCPQVSLTSMSFGQFKNLNLRSQEARSSEMTRVLPFDVVETAEPFSSRAIGNQLMSNKSQTTALAPFKLWLGRSTHCYLTPNSELVHVFLTLKCVFCLGLA
jgi:hypothetical protein